MSAGAPASLMVRIRSLCQPSEHDSLLPPRLAVILLFALILRLGWMFAFTAVIENEGSEYARIAENLLTGIGYVGKREEGPQVLFPPLFPLLIAAVSVITGHTDLAGRLVSAVLGTGLVLAVFLVTDRIHGRKVAYAAAVLTTLHPWLIAMSATVYSETTYLTLLMAGAYWALRSLELRSRRHAVLSGVFFGLAYLTRPEAFVFPFIALAFVTAINRRRFAMAVRHSCALLGPFLLLAAPYIAFLTYHAGTVRIEGKAPVNYQIGQRMLAGMNYLEAAYGLQEDLTPRGVYLRPDVSVLRSTPLEPREMLHYVSVSARRNLPWVLRALLAAPYFGAPLLPVLVILGLFRKPWSYARAVHETFLFAIFIGVLLALLSVQFLYPRFLYPLLPVLIIWASRGISELSRWTAGTVAGVGGGRRQRSAFAAATRWGTGGALLFIVLVGAWPEPDMTQGRPAQRPIRDAGEWLNRAHPGPKRIMDSTGVIAFYARAALLYLPYADSALALSYIESKQPDFIVVRSAVLNRPYLQQWAGSGIPDDRAELIYRYHDAVVGSVLIYRWTR